MNNVEQGQELVRQYGDLLVEYGPRVIAAAIILGAGYLAARLLRGLVRRLLTRAGVEPTLVPFFGNLTYLVLLVFVVIAALEKLGVSTTSFAAVVAAAGLAIGLALRDSLSNFAAGFLIIVLRPFKVGDFIEAAGISGGVEAIKVFATELKTPDNKMIIVPNSSILASNIINYSAKKRRRVDLVFGIGYGDDLRAARQILEEILAEDPRILDDPAPQVVVLELADSSVDFAVRPWVRVEDVWAVQCAVTEKVKLAFDAHGITIPYPQQEVHLRGAAQD